MNCGTWVVFPQPVSPDTTNTCRQQTSSVADPDQLNQHPDPDFLLNPDQLNQHPNSDFLLNPDPDQLNQHPNPDFLLDADPISNHYF
jgi:hypothetical protein